MASTDDINSFSRTHCMPFALKTPSAMLASMSEEKVRRITGEDVASMVVVLFIRHAFCRVVLT